MKSIMQNKIHDFTLLDLASVFMNGLSNLSESVNRATTSRRDVNAYHIRAYNNNLTITEVLWEQD